MAAGSRRLLTISAAVVSWSILLLQYVLLVRATWDGPGPGLATLQFFSYFTVLSNLLVALVLTFSFCLPLSPAGRLLASARVRAGVALYIGVTAGIYFFVLRMQWAPQGWQWVADAGLHYVVPAIYWSWWLADSGNRGLAWGDVVRWLVFPALFLAGVLVRGAWLHVYPYPFLEVDTLGAAVVARNCAMVFVLFVLAGLAIVAVDRGLARART